MTVPPIRTGYEPREHQKIVHRNRKRFSVLVCHRRFGKTVLAINELQHAALTCKHREARVAYIAPYLRQAKAIAWDYAKRFALPIPGAKVNESELRIDYPTGGRLRLFGADNADALRGQYFDDVVLDEYAQIAPSVWTEVIRPALADRGGWALFTGTPKGRNAFYELYEAARRLEADNDKNWRAFLFRASETGILPPDELSALKAQMQPEEYEQELECSFQAALVGAYYGREMEAAEREGRIRTVAYDPQWPVETWWDLGVDDATAIWFVQIIGREFRVLRYYENASAGLEHYAEIIKATGWRFSRHVLPHDGDARELGTGLTRVEQLRRYLPGALVLAAPRQRVEDGIAAAREILKRAWFDERGCGPERHHRGGLEALRQYQRAWDEKLGVFRATPQHDWASHGADAFRTGALMWRMHVSSTPPEQPRRLRPWERQAGASENSWKTV